MNYLRRYELIKTDNEASILILEKKIESIASEIKTLELSRGKIVDDIAERIDLRAFLKNMIKNAKTGELVPKTVAPHTSVKQNEQTHSRGPHSENDVRMILYRQNMTDAQISKKTGRTTAAIRKWRHRAGLEPNKTDSGLKRERVKPHKENQGWLLSIQEMVMEILNNTDGWVEKKDITTIIHGKSGLAVRTVEIYIPTSVRNLSNVEKRIRGRTASYRLKPKTKEVPLYDNTEPVRSDHLARLEAQRSSMT